MERGFLSKQQSQKETSTTHTTESDAGDHSKIVSATPFIVCPDTRLLPNIVHFLYLPQGKKAIVVVDTLDKLNLIADSPGWKSTSTPVKPTSPAPAFDVAPVPGKGLGLVANREIHQGEVLLIEQPTVVFPRNTTPQAWKVIESAIARLDDERKAGIAELHNSFTNIFDTTEGILRTNGLPLTLTVEDKATTAEESSYLGVGTILSHVNHDCTPSALHTFDPSTFAFRNVALRKIFKDEEITISYIPPTLAFEQRQRELGHARFVCEGKTCSLDPELRKVSDARRERMGAAQLKGALPHFVELEVIEDALLAAEEEGLVQEVSQLFIHAAVYFMGEGNDDKVREYGIRAMAQLAWTEGLDSVNTLGFATLLEFHDQSPDVMQGLRKEQLARKAAENGQPVGDKAKDDVDIPRTADADAEGENTGNTPKSDKQKFKEGHNGVSPEAEVTEKFGGVKLEDALADAVSENGVNAEGVKV